jgi:hypothetical protein
MAEKGPRVEVVWGRRVETVEFGLRTAKDNIFHRKGHVEQMSSLERAVDCRDRPFCGWKGDEQVVTRTVVVYTTQWTEVPGYEGSLWFDCWHENRPDAHAAAGGHAAPHPFRERDMVPGEDGVCRYTCPVCGLMWRFRDDTPDKPAENMPADIPPDEPLLTLF